MNRAKIISVLILLAVIFAACASAEKSQQSEDISTSAPSSQPDLARNTGGGGGGREDTSEKLIAQNQVSLETGDKNPTEPVKPVERKIIRNADLQLETDSPEEDQKKISAIVESKGGFVVESTQSSRDVKAVSRDIVTMTVRVPAEKFAETLEEIRKSANRVIVETVKGQDVTEEFIDIEARLKAKRALEEQFLEIMKRANSVEDALNVQKQLAEVRGEIEKIEGRKRFLENQASLSTIRIHLQTPTAFTPNSGGFFYRLTDSIRNGFDFAMSFVLGFITFLIAILPFVLLVLLPIYLVLRYFWKRLRFRKPATQPEEIVREEIKED
ncbi:MAG: DUF4349 domain-containing protein [Pyrinomonadaceae bacterium]|nr:DUF4349 domain-containing protein [Pyrinomonadaceae bacterium]